MARYFVIPPLRLISLDIVDGERFKDFAIFLIDKLADKPRDISSRSNSVNARVERIGLTGFIPPYFCRKQKMERQIQPIIATPRSIYLLEI